MYKTKYSVKLLHFLIVIIKLFKTINISKRMKKVSILFVL